MSFSSEEGSAELKDPRIVFQNLHSVLDENIAFFRGQGSSEPARRFVAVFSLIQSHARSLEPAIHAFTSVYHVFDFDAATPANGYRSLVKVVLSCLLHIVHKGRYISSSRRSLFFRASHNVTELESYCSALCQLRALVYFAQRLLTANRHGDLFFLEERGLSEEFVRQYASMHKGCFYGRCMGSQVRREGRRGEGVCLHAQGLLLREVRGVPGSTAERVCLAGDSAGGNLCLTVSMRAASYGVRLPDGIMTAYPATLLTATASPSRLLTLIDPLLPLSVLSKCLSAYAGTEPMPQKRAEKVNTMSLVRKDTALLLRDFRLGASAWISSLLDNGRGGKNSSTGTRGERGEQRHGYERGERGEQQHGYERGEGRTAARVREGRGENSGTGTRGERGEQRHGYEREERGEQQHGYERGEREGGVREGRGNGDGERPCK
ncbi:UNVERIFIED_CONTAM: hypothetical protein FKN15_011190 [Acipenser sinensis]